MIGRNAVGLAPNEKTWLSYEEAREMMHKRKIRSRRQYLKWHDLYRPTFVPKAPHRVYKEEFVGWNDFLGNNNTFWHEDKGPFMSFWDAARWAQSQNFESIAAWRDYVKHNELPPGIPKHPDNIYKDIWYKGVAWTEFLGLNVTSQVSVQQQVAEHSVWAIIQKSEMPMNVISVIRESKSVVQQNVVRGNYKLLAMFVYEQDLESQLWDEVNTLTSPYYEEGDRLCHNVNQLIANLQYFLLVVRD